MTRSVAIHFQWKGQLSLSICFPLIFFSSFQRVNSPLVTLSKSLKPPLILITTQKAFLLLTSPFFLKARLACDFSHGPSGWPQFPVVLFLQPAFIVLVKTREICRPHLTSCHSGKVPAFKDNEIPKCKQENRKVFFLLASYLGWSEQCSLLLGLMVWALLTCGRKESILLRAAIHFSSKF